jgi:copper resistance protein C
VSATQPRTALRRFVIGAVALLVTILGAMPAAQAHDYLVGSTPKLNSTVTTAPKRVSLTFNDIVLTRPAPPQLSVRGPDGRYYETGCATVTDATVDIPVALGGAGKYTVTWRIVSADGHPVSDSISFTYHPKGRTAGAKGIAAPKQCSANGSAGAASAAPDKSSGGGTPTAAIVAVVVIAVVGVVGAALILVTRGDRRDETIDDEDEHEDDED